MAGNTQLPVPRENQHVSLGPASMNRARFQTRMARRRRSIAAFRATANAQRTPAQRFADGLAKWFGSTSFVGLHFLWFIGWIVWNLGLIPFLAPFDPFPFGLLTMIVSLEAIFLSAFILLSQNRQSDLADLRAEISLQLNMVQDEKTSALVRALDRISRRMNMEDVLDPELAELEDPVDLVALEQETRAETEQRPIRPRAVEEVLLRVRRAVDADDWDEAVALLEAMRPADQADVFSELELEDQAELLPRLSVEDSADILEELEDEEAAEVAERLDKRVLSRILDEMEPDEAADVLGDLDPVDRDEALRGMSPEDAEEVRPLLIHPDESAGGLMTSEFLALRRRMTAADALEAVRQWSPESEALYTLWVVDGQGALVGMLSLRRLVTANPHALLREIMDPDLISVHVAADPDECARLMSRYGLLALPVVDERNHLLGMITVDDLLEAE